MIYITRLSWIITLVIIMSGKHRKVECSVCKKVMRSDHLQRHMKIHKDLLSLSEDELEKELLFRNEIRLKDEETLQKRRKVVDVANRVGVPVPEEVCDLHAVGEIALREQLIRNNRLYLDKVQLGKTISKILEDSGIHEESLVREHRDALDLYREQMTRMEIDNVVLRPWQRDVFSILRGLPNDRSVMWIYDKYGNTGKSWFQNYVEAYYGYSFVFRCDLRINHKDICNILRKRSLAAVGIFMFNDSRSIPHGNINLYRILEDIKDGAATSTKYDNHIIKFRTPNHVIVFSNRMPEKENLTDDRWRLYKPVDDGLVEI